MKRILVVRLGALGDFVLSFAPFAAIRAHHVGAEITLLTTAPFVGLALKCPWFDHVVIDERPSWWNIKAVIRLARSLRGFDFVYDLQTSGRSSRYFILARRPPWSGIAPGCSHPQSDPAREVMHTIERQRDQLRIAGILDIPRPDLGFLTSLPTPPLPQRFALLIPGAAPSRPAKRWPHFAELAPILAARGLTPVVIGTKSEAPLAAAITARCRETIDLTGQTDIPTLFAVASHATLAIGNDTGPMHIAAAVDTPSIVLFGADSDPALTAPRHPDGRFPTILRETDLADLPPERVASAIA